MRLLNAQAAWAGDADRTISGGMACDVMSLSMAHGCRDMAWVCARADMNALAVAAMTQAACLVLVQRSRVDERLIDRARRERINVLMTSMTAFEAVGRMYAAGVRPAERRSGGAV